MLAAMPHLEGEIGLVLEVRSAVQAERTARVPPIFHRMVIVELAQVVPMQQKQGS